MSDIASTNFAPSQGLFGRLMASIDRLLLASAPHRGAERRPALFRALKH